MSEFNSQPYKMETRRVSDTGSLLPVPVSQTVVDTTASAAAPFDIWGLVKKYAFVGVLATILGLALGFLAVAFFPPVYRARARLEVQPMNSGVLKLQGIDGDGGQVDLQTETQIVLSTNFLRQVLQRVQLETPPPPPALNDVFSKVRRRLKIGAYDEVPVAILREGLENDQVPKPVALAIRSLDAHAIMGTRIIEITCESTNPEVASNFLNALTDEYIQRNIQARMDSVRVTTQWLSQQVEETKNKMIEAEQRLQEFVRSSGNLFVAEDKDNTLANTQLREYQERLSAAQADLITKQTRYEMVQKTRPESLPDVLEDADIREYGIKLADLQRQRATLTTTLMPANPKVKRVDTEIAELQSAQKKAINAAQVRIATDYETALRNRDALNSAYMKQAARVGAQATKEAEYNALKKESESARQTYNTMLLQANQLSVTGTAPVNNIRVTDPAIPPQLPIKPKPFIIIGAGGLIGFALCGGIVFLRERMNQRVTSPSHARQLLNLPQLGVIPSVEDTKKKWQFLPAPSKTLPSLNVSNEAQATSEADGRKLGPISPLQTPALAESFRVTVAALMRESDRLRQPQVILVTSPGPEEGKTTIASNLGIALAETGRTVLLLDADFRRPKAHKVFGMPNAKGLVDLLEADAPVSTYSKDALGQRTGISHLLLLPNGRRSENISKALYSPRLRELLSRLRREFDTVLIDAPPMLHVADARVLSEMADGVVLVVRSGVTSKDSAVEALDQLRADGTFIFGTVLNDWTPGKAELKKSYYYTTFESYDRS